MLVPVTFHKIFLNTAAFVSMTANGLLLLLLLTRNGNHLGNYRLLLVIFALTDIFISIFHAWYIPMFVLGDFGYIFFGYGILRETEETVAMAVLVYSILFYMPFCLLCVHFIYRYLSLISPNALKKRFPLFMFCCSIYTAIYSISSGILVAEGSKVGVPERLQGMLDEYGLISRGYMMNLRTVDYYDDDNEINMKVIAVLCGCAALGGHVVLISLYCIRKIVGAFRNITMEINTRRLHQSLFRALLIQFTVPVVFSLLPFSLIVLFPGSGIQVEQWGNVFSLLASVFPALDPILIILSLGRFRATLREWLDEFLGTKARRNEKRAEELSKAHYSLMIRRMSRSSEY